MKAPYHEIGVVNTKEVFKKAMEGGYAVPAYNFNNMEQLQAIIIGCASRNRRSSSRCRRRAGLCQPDPPSLHGDGRGPDGQEMGSKIPITLHLDHGDSFELCRSCIESGFSSVMIDGSHLPYEGNIKLTSRWWITPTSTTSASRRVGCAGRHRGRRGGREIQLHRPKQVQDFVGRTGVHSLAISIAPLTGPTSSS